MLLRRTLILLTTLIFFMADRGFSQSTTIVISQVYGGGGNTGATYNADYVELHNVSSVSQSLAGLSIQYASSTGAFSFLYALPVSASIPPGGYYLIQMTGSGAVGSPLPTPDTFATPAIALGGTNGKVALVNGTTLVTTCPDPLMIDLVGYGSATCSETAPVSALSATLAAIRNNNGCTETNTNNIDFIAALPAPRNSASAPFLCSGGPANPSILAGTVNNFGGVTVLTASSSQSFQIFGSNLTGAPGNIAVTAPSTDFQVSADNSTWGPTASIPYSSPTLSSTLIYVRFTPQTLGPKSGNLTINGGGISNPVSVAVAGNGTTATPSLHALVISQVYGAGGNSGAAYNADFVEIHNRSNVPQRITGFSVQYGSSTTTSFWSGKTKLPDDTIPAGGFYLIQMSGAGTIGLSLPAPDHIASPAIGMGQNNGRVALVSDTVLLYGCPTTLNMEDLVGYGSSICSETASTPAIDSLNAVFRNNNGCDDTNNNSLDFTLLPAAPRNSATAASICNTPCIANYWTGAVSTAWENAGNWSCGSIPDSNSVVYIEAGKPRYPIVTSNASCKTIFTATGATLRVDPNFRLNVLGN